MKTTFNIFKYCTTLVLLICLIVSPLGQRVPQAEAGGGGLATEFTALGNKVQTTISAVQGTITAGATSGLLAKEFADGIGWAIAKQMVSNMTRSLINWINSGFQGSPAFITDLDTFLLDALDTVAGEYISSLGGIGEFICSPFKLDVRAALEISYAQARSGLPSGPTTPACTLTDIADNIEGFLTGIGNNGWEDWLTVTRNPENTPYGAYLAAEAELNIRLKNEAGKEIEIASWGNGFLSKKICEGFGGQSGGQRCTITTPGQVISEALTFQLSTGPRALIEADEINELIGALINQLALQAMQGINGLLGLGGNSSRTDYSYGNGSTTQSYIDAAADEMLLVTNLAIKNQMSTALSLELTMAELASSTLATIPSHLALVRAGQDAITTIFSGANNTDQILNLSMNSTPNYAQNRLNIRSNNDDSDSPQGSLATAQDELDAVFASLSSIKNVRGLSDDTDLGTLTFNELVTEGNRVQNELLALQTEIIGIKIQTESNITKLRSFIAQMDSTTISAKDREDAVTEFTTLMNSGTLTNSAQIATRRLAWEGKLN